MIRRCKEKDAARLFQIINDAAERYRGVIPRDRWKSPYMPRDELERDIASGVEFWGYESGDQLIGVMGKQDVKDVTLIRHAYVLPSEQEKGIGGQLLTFLQTRTTRPLLIGTWADADWAVRFYQNRGFRLVSDEEKDRLLEKYWSVPRRQVETSVVLADKTWFKQQES